MTIGHRWEQDELSDTSLYELYSQLGEKDTPKLFEQPYRIDTGHDCPTGAGNSLDRKTIYIDRVLFEETMDGAFKATGLTPEQLVGRWCDHEHTEISISHGNNCSDTYAPCHDRALRREHEGVLAILRPATSATAMESLKTYEKTFWPALVRCYHRPVVKPPKDLWCGPVLDEPTERDEEILETFRKLGVVDAQKHSKLDVHYGFGEAKCNDCRGWQPELVSQERGALAACRRISGLVREDRWCSMWHERQEENPI